MVNRLIVVVGAGPGLGRTTAVTFAKQGFAVGLLSRNTKRLEEDVAAVKASAPGVQVKSYTVDVGDHIALKATLEQVGQEMGPPEVLYFNAARVQPSRIGQTSPEYLLEDFKTMNIGLYVSTTWAIPHLIAMAKEPEAHPSILFGGSGIMDHPIGDFFGLSLQKAAQYNLAGSLNQLVGPQGVHVASVTIGGILDDNDPDMNAGLIASKLWELYRQDRHEWEFEIRVGDILDLIKKMQAQQK